MSVLSFDARLLAGLPHVVGISDLEIRVTASGTYLYSASELDGGLGVYQLDGPTPVLIDSLSYNSGSGTLGASGLLLGSISSRDFLLPAGRFDDRAVVHEISTSGHFLSSVAVPYSGGSESSWAETATAVFGGETFVFAHRRGQTGVEVFRLTSDLSVIQTSGTQPPALSPMTEISALATIQRGETAFLIAASAFDSSLGVFALGAEGSLIDVHWLEAGAGLPINTPVDAEVTTIGETDYLVLGSFGTSSISVFRIAQGGNLILTDHKIDDTSTRFGGLQTLDVLTANDRTYVTAGGADDGITFFELSGDGRLHHLTSIADTAESGLQNVSAVAAALVGQQIRVFAAGAEPGLSQFSFSTDHLGPQNLGTHGADDLMGTVFGDLLVGFGGTDVLSGGAGNDRLVDGDGMDFMIGGAGADVFVFAADARLDVVLDFEANLDVLDLSGINGLNNFSQLDFRDLAVGTLISVRGEVIWIPVEGLSSNAFDTDDFVF